jgi:putative aminopeptidase FrvX
MNDSFQFLRELLHTPSPSGFETDIQKKWIKHVNSYADHIETDEIGNVFATVNRDAPFKVMLAGHCDEIGFMVNSIDEQGFIYITKVGGISPKPAVGMKVDILGRNKTVSGVIGVNAEHHGGIKDKFGMTDLFIDCGFKNKEEAMLFCEVGDYVVYKREIEILENNTISGRGLDNRTGLFIIAEVLQRVAKANPKVCVIAASTVHEETNMAGAYFASAKTQPNIAIACDVTFATDYPGVDKRKHGDVALHEGPALAKGAGVHQKINELLLHAAARQKINVQYELTPRLTGTDADKIRFSGRGVPVALVSLPLRYMHSPVETASLLDIEACITLLTDMISSLSGSENLKPL